MCLFAVCITSSEKLLFRYFARFIIGVFVFLLWSLEKSSYVLETSPFYSFTYIFSQSVVGVFIFFVVSLGEQKILTLVKSSSSVSCVVDCAFGVVSEKSLPNVRL